MSKKLKMKKWIKIAFIVLLVLVSLGVALFILYWLLGGLVFVLSRTGNGNLI